MRGEQIKIEGAIPEMAVRSRPAAEAADRLPDQLRVLHRSSGFFEQPKGSFPDERIT